MPTTTRHDIEDLARVSDTTAEYLCSCGTRGYGSVPFPDWDPLAAARLNHAQHARRASARAAGLK